MWQTIPQVNAYKHLYKSDYLTEEEIQDLFERIILKK